MRLLVCLFLFITVCLSGQSVSFIETDLEAAKARAAREGKTLFVSTYASYCIPCKKQAEAFKDPALARYFNDNFINVRVNVETTLGKAYALKYQIVFLPTLIFVDQSGYERMKIDRLVSTYDLLRFAKIINNDYTTTQSSTNVNPPPRQTKTIAQAPSSQNKTSKEIREEAITNKDTKIVYVMGQDNGDLPPEILKEEAYFRMQLMDGSEIKAAQKYLDTQEDWGTDVNIRFIHDFLHDTRSDGFEYMLDNKVRFEEVIGRAQIHQTINILVNKELERGYPKPDFERAYQLYAMAGDKTARSSAIVYHADNLYSHQDKTAFIAFCDANDVAVVRNAELLYRYSDQKATLTNNHKQLKYLMGLASKAVELNPNQPIYHYNKAKIAFLLKDKKKALNSCNEAKTHLGPEDGDVRHKIEEILRLVDQL